MRISIPDSLFEYIRIRDNEIVVIKEVPEELKNQLEDFKQEYTKILEKKRTDSALPAWFTKKE